MIYRLVQIACVIGGVLTVMMLLVTANILVKTWTDYGFGNARCCDDAQRAFFVMAARTAVTFLIPLLACALGFWWASRAHKKRALSSVG